MEVVVTTGAIKRANCHHQHQHPPLYRLDALRVAQPTASKHWREIYGDNLFDSKKATSRSNF